MSQTELRKAIKGAIKVATDMLYPASVINRLETCKSDIEIERVIHDARNNIYS